LAPYESRYIGVSIDRPPEDVYAFASKPENLGKWATGLGESIRQVDGQWVAESPIGSVRIEFAERNALGVLDHDVILESGERVHNAIRVVPNANGSEVIFILFRRPEMSDEKLAEDAAWVQKDLGILKDLLEGGRNDGG
jgi:hypothetical protein